MLYFFIVTFALAWSCQLPVFLLGLDGPIAFVLLGFGGIAPTIGALVVTRGAVWRETWRRPGASWPLVVAVVYPTVCGLIGGLIQGRLGGLALGVPWIPALILPPIGEELGWRGYLQPVLARRLGTLGASVVVGVVWAIWHVPTAIGSLDTYPLFALSIVAHSIVIGSLWRLAGRSTLVGLVAHFGINLGLLPLPRPAGIIVLCAAAVVAAFVAVLMEQRQDWTAVNCPRDPQPPLS